MRDRSDEWEAEWETDDDEGAAAEPERPSPPRIAPLVAMRRQYMREVRKNPRRNVEQCVDNFT